MAKIEGFTKPTTNPKGIKIDGKWMTCSDKVWEYNSTKRTPFMIKDFKLENDIVVFLTPSYDKPNQGFNQGFNKSQKPDNIQKLIIRQSSLERAVETYALFKEQITETSLMAISTIIKEIANDYAKWVMEEDKEEISDEDYL